MDTEIGMEVDYYREDTKVYPIQAPQNTVLDSLIAAEKAAEDLRNKLSLVIREFVEGDRDNDSSMSSLALDVSKISVLKGAECKTQFASSPNLSGLGTVREDSAKSRLRRFESASTSNLAPKEGKISKLRRISPNIFKAKKDSPTVTDKTQDGKASKLNSLLKPKIVTPVRGTLPRTNSEASPSLSSSKKKFSHVKSTIPRPTPKKE